MWEYYVAPWPFASDPYGDSVMPLGLGNFKLVQLLDDCGKEGWELVHVQFEVAFVFKRQRRVQ